MSNIRGSNNYLGIDHGVKKIGVAIAPHGQQALPLGTYLTESGIAEREILKLIKERDISHIVVGLPLDQGGERTAQCVKIERFCRRISKRAKVEFIYVDEHLTSKEAASRLESRGIPPEMSSAKKLLDQYAATIILQEYLDSKIIEKR